MWRTLRGVGRGRERQVVVPPQVCQHAPHKFQSIRLLGASESLFLNSREKLDS